MACDKTYQPIDTCESYHMLGTHHTKRVPKQCNVTKYLFGGGGVVV